MKIRDCKNFPECPGVYIMKDKQGGILYIGKAGNLRRRISSYFASSKGRSAFEVRDARMEQMVGKIADIRYQETRNALEALMLEAKLIKKYQPPFNIKEKDDKSFLYVEIARERYPQVRLVRGTVPKGGVRFGPFANSSDIKAALRALRRIFPFSTHPPEKAGAFDRPCLDAEIGLCPGTCTGKFDKEKYRRDIASLKQVLGGKTGKLVKDLEGKMKTAAEQEKFERAAELRRQLFALRHINDIAFVRGARIQNSANRIEGYDISCLSGTSAVGAMVVFTNGEPDKDEYRKFRIRTVKNQNDVGMLKEVLRRRFRHDEWKLPDMVLVDGGRAQTGAAEKVIGECGLGIPVVGIAKGPRRKKNEFYGSVPKGVSRVTLVHIRNEAHRFAVEYHRKIRWR